MTPAPGGRPPCAKSRSPAPSCSTRLDTPAACFEALIVDNLDLGRPHNVEIIFGRRVRRDTIGTFRTAIDRREGGGVRINVFYRHSRSKQYLNHGRAMRIETVGTAPRDLGCNARLPNLDDLQAKARACNQRILQAQAGRSGLRPRESSL